MMNLLVNGEERTIDAPVSITEYLAACGLKSRMVVVERNGVILPRDRYDNVVLEAGDVLEIVQMMAGG